MNSALVRKGGRVQIVLKVITYNDKSLHWLHFTEELATKFSNPHYLLPTEYFNLITVKHFNNNCKCLIKVAMYKLCTLRIIS